MFVYGTHSQKILAASLFFTKVQSTLKKRPPMQNFTIKVLCAPYHPSISLRMPVSWKNLSLFFVQILYLAPDQWKHFTQWKQSVACGQSFSRRNNFAATYLRYRHSKNIFTVNYSLAKKNINPHTYYKAGRPI